MEMTSKSFVNTIMLSWMLECLQFHSELDSFQLVSVNCFIGFLYQKQPRLGNCNTRDKMFTFCEAFNGWCSMFSSLIKNLSCKCNSFQLAFEA